MAQKFGKELVIGDTIAFGGRPHSITGFSERRPFVGAYMARTAYCGTKAITLMDTDYWLECPTHRTYEINGCTTCDTRSH